MWLKLKSILIFISTILIHVQSSYGECIHYEIWVIIVLQNDYIHKIPFPANWTKMSRFVINRSNECFTASIIWWFDLNVRGRSLSSVLLVMLLLWLSIDSWSRDLPKIPSNGLINDGGKSSRGSVARDPQNNNFPAS